MLRFLFALALASPAVLVPLSAQVYTIQPRPMQVENKPRGGFSLSFRYGGSTNVRFEDVGAIASLRSIGDTLSESGRTYDDGFVGLDSRGGAGAGSVGDDGRTNTWVYGYASQVTPEGDIEMHRYTVASNGTDVEVDSGSLAGIDMQYDMVFGVFGGKVTDKAWSFTWGGSVGGVYSPINAKARATITANLLTTTDTYSLEGAAVPGAPYTAPSQIVIGDLTLDNTTLLNNRPYRRTLDVLTPNGATVDGYWQLKGGYYTLRVGPWFRWQLSRRLSVRASVGATYTFLGLTMEHDEVVDHLQAVQILRGGSTSTPKKGERYGYFGALDAEFWLTERTGFFAGVTTENTGDDLAVVSGDLASGGRRAVIELPKGTGFRAGISVLF